MSQHGEAMWVGKGVRGYAGQGRFMVLCSLGKVGWQHRSGNGQVAQIRETVLPFPSDS